MRVEYWWLIVPAAAAVAATITDYLPFKMGVPILCALILSLAFMRHSVSAIDIWWVVGAFAASAAGDYFLSNKRGNGSYFVIGIGLYLLAHVGYLVAAWRNGGVNIPTLAVLLAVLVTYYIVLLNPAIGDPILSIAVLVYLLISCLALAVAAGLSWERAVKLFYVIGIALIVLSDLAISFNEFLDFKTFNVIILPTYYLAHLAITFSLLRRG